MPDVASTPAPTVNDIAVNLRSLHKSYGQSVAVDDVSLEVRRGEFFSLLGPSGCGKTTTLRMIAGLLQPDAGQIEIMGEDVTDRPAHRRNIGMVFQNYALFPHMTVAENVAFGLKMRKIERSVAAERVERVLDLVQLGGAKGRLPRELSGGQQQRVALARAIVIEPRLLLLDEPLSNLDAKLRKEMQIELRTLQRRLNITAVYVTHDQEEALTLSDRIAIMNRGCISQCSAPSEIYRNPANRFVAEFIGRVNLLRGWVSSDGSAAVFRMEQGSTLRLPNRVLSELGTDAPVDLVLRPENVRLDPTGPRIDDAILVPGTIRQAVYTGATTSYVVEVEGGFTMTAEQQNTLGEPLHQEGDRVTVYIDPAAVYTVPHE